MLEEKQDVLTDPPLSPCERAFVSALDRTANQRQPTPWSMYEVFKAWARDIDRRGVGEYHKLQKLAAERLGL